MLAAIDFNNKMCIKANEINYIVSNRLLSAELQASGLYLSQLSPENCLGLCEIMP